MASAPLNSLNRHSTSSSKETKKDEARDSLTKTVESIKLIESRVSTSSTERSLLRSPVASPVTQEVRKDPSNPPPASKSELTPLMQLMATPAEKGEEELTLLLVENIDINARVPNGEYRGFTALHFAAMHGELRYVEMLIAWGADPNICTNTGVTPLSIAMNKLASERNLTKQRSYKQVVAYLELARFVSSEKKRET